MECFSCSRLRAPSLLFLRSSCCPAQLEVSHRVTSWLRRLPVLYLRCAPLQLAAGRGALWFFAFCAVWAGLAIHPAAPAQFNSAYMLIYFVGGSVGTAFGAAAVGWFGWPATTAIAACAIALAMIVTATVRGNTRSLG